MKKTTKTIPLVLLHGYPFDRTLWYATIASLGAGAKVLAPDLPGFGRNELLQEAPSMSGLADWVARYLDEHQVPAAMVAGMSMGGYVALAFAERHPNRLLGLGLISSQAAADTDQTKKARKDLIQKINKEGHSVAAAGILPKLFMKSKPAPPELEAYPRAGAQKANVAGLTWALEAMARRSDRSQLVKSLKLPVLFAHGKEDQIVPIQTVRALAEQCHDPIFVELKAGHATPLEAPDELAQALLRFVNRVQELQPQTVPAAQGR